MNTNPIDPLGHLTLAVKDIKKSKEFYQKIFAQLKIKKQVEKETGTAWEFLPGFSLWIKQAQHKDMNYKFHAPGFHHLCIKAKSKKEVDDFYNFLLSFVVRTSYFVVPIKSNRCNYY